MRKTPKKPWNLCLKSTSAALERHIKGMWLGQVCICNFPGGSHLECLGQPCYAGDTRQLLLLAGW